MQIQIINDVYLRHLYTPPTQHLTRIKRSLRTYLLRLEPVSRESNYSIRIYELSWALPLMSKLLM